MCILIVITVLDLCLPPHIVLVLWITDIIDDYKEAEKNYHQALKLTLELGYDRRILDYEDLKEDYIELTRLIRGDKHKSNLDRAFVVSLKKVKMKRRKKKREGFSIWKMLEIGKKTFNCGASG